MTPLNANVDEVAIFTAASETFCKKTLTATLKLVLNDLFQ